MRNLGIVRDIDKLGRFVIPVELRNKLDIENGDAIEIFAEQDKIILRKYEKYCIFCKEEKTDLVGYLDKPICKKCIDEIKKL